jgi:SMODS-associated and fused to various effectors sensor domain
MSKAVAPRWHGDNYQSRFFWIHAASLLDPEKPEVVEVTFEADGPKAFDDVVVRYDPGRPRASGPGRITVDYHQIKWHVDSSGRFGFEDLTDPAFIGATSVSILERLKSAKNLAEEGAAFHLITTDRVTDGDQLGELISLVDGSLRLQVLKEGKTDASRMGKVRKCWREHLKLSSDEELYGLLEGLHITEGHATLEKLRHDVSLKFRLVGLVGAENETAFIYDEAARQLLIKNLNRFDRISFQQWCETEQWFLSKRVVARRSVALSTFPPRSTPAHMREASAENTLSFVDQFNGRLLREGVTWEDLKAPIIDFLRARLAEAPAMRLFLEAHSSVAFLAGSLLRFKDGADVEIVQKGDKNPGIVWDSIDGCEGPPPVINIEPIGSGKDIVLAVGLTRDPIKAVMGYVERCLPGVGTVMQVAPSNGVSQAAITGGQHAAAIADAISNAVREARHPGGTTHIFLVAPNAFSFMLGQQAESMGRCTLYEYDFSGQIDGSYQPTFSI